MNISTVRDNLISTIAGKEACLKAHKEVMDPEDLTAYAIAMFLKININELQRILQDVEQCIEKVEE